MSFISFKKYLVDFILMITISVLCWYNVYVVDNFSTGSPGDAVGSYMFPGLSTHSALLGSASCLRSLFSALAYFGSYFDSFSSVCGNWQMFLVLFLSWAFLNEQVIDVSEDHLATLSYRCISTYLAAFHNLPVSLYLFWGKGHPLLPFVSTWGSAVSCLWLVVSHLWLVGPYLCETPRLCW